MKPLSTRDIIRLVCLCMLVWALPVTGLLVCLLGWSEALVSVFCLSAWAIMFFLMGIMFFLMGRDWERSDEDREKERLRCEIFDLKLKIGEEDDDEY